MVSIVAFQAVDPGSIPGHRTFFYSYLIVRLVLKSIFTCFFLIFLFHSLLSQRNSTIVKVQNNFRYRESNPSLLGESQVS